MNARITSSWVPFLISAIACAVMVAVSINDRGFDRAVAVGTLILLAVVLWELYSHYTTYVEIVDNRWLTNTGDSTSVDTRFDITSILYIARAPRFIVMSWGYQMIIYFRYEMGQIRITQLPEIYYPLWKQKALLEKLLSIKPNIELDPIYHDLLDCKDVDNFDLTQITPRTMKEVEAYVAEHYGPPT